jgi:predicted phage-related endonuclease
MTLKSMKAFERRWAILRRLAAAQLKDFERDKKEIARAVKQYKVKKDLLAAREAVLHSKRVTNAIKETKKFVVQRDRLVADARRRGGLIKKAFSR